MLADWQVHIFGESPYHPNQQCIVAVVTLKHIKVEAVMLGFLKDIKY